MRRSFEQAAPLYQAAYLLGGIQIRASQGTRGLGPHDRKAIPRRDVRQGNMPIALHRLALSRTMKLTPDTSLDPRFYGDIEPK